MRTSPITKTGSDRPMSTATLERRSNRLRDLVALRIPTESPTTSQMITPPITSDRVGGRSCLSIVFTDCWVKNEYPRLPCSRPSMKCQTGRVLFQRTRRKRARCRLCYHPSPACEHAEETPPTDYRDQP
jgi:hypothetical protein